MTVFGDTIALNYFTDSLCALSSTHRKRGEYRERCRGISSLYEARIYRSSTAYKHHRKLPLLNIRKNGELLQQILIVICITTLITLRNNTETFFRNTRDSLNAIFKSVDYTESNVLQTRFLMRDIETQFDTYFHLVHTYSDYYLYRIPYATLELAETVSYRVSKYNYSNMSIELHNTPYNYIKLYFEVESYSFHNDIRNLWHWYLIYSYDIDDVTHRVIPTLSIDYERLSTNVSWWNTQSYSFVCFVVASSGLTAFPIVALFCFLYQHCKYEYEYVCDKLKQLSYRILFPISYVICSMCGITCLLNLFQIYDLNDEWEFRLFIAVTAMVSWCMLSFALHSKQTQYGVLFNTVGLSLKPLIMVGMATLPIVIGYILFGTLYFGIPRHGPKGQQMFSDPETTAKTLYSIVLGDNIYNTFETVLFSNVIGEIYVYSWCILFISVIFNVFLSIIVDKFFLIVPPLEISSKKEDIDCNDISSDDYCTLNWTLYQVQNVSDMISISSPTNSNAVEMELTNLGQKQIHQNEKYIEQFISYLNNKTMTQITTLIMKQINVRDLVEHQDGWDYLQHDIYDHYKKYLKHVSVQANAYVQSKCCNGNPQEKC